MEKLIVATLRNRRCLSALVMKPLISTFFTLLLFGFTGSSYGQVTQIERDALIALYNSTVGANWTDNTGWVGEGGVLHLAIYSSKEVFESDRGDKPGAQPGIEAGVVEKISKGTYKGSFEIPPGTYAIGVYIDENEKLDTNFLGIPKEQYGFSNNAKAFGIPKFEAASFVIDTYKKVQIGL